MFLAYVKGKVYPVTGHEGPEGEYRYKSAFFNLCTKWEGGQCHIPAALPLGKWPSIHCTGSSGAPGPV